MKGRQKSVFLLNARPLFQIMSKTALVLGPTGLVGHHLVRLLCESPHYDTVIAVARRPLDWQHPKLRTEIFDYDHPDASKIVGDDLFCALGTTIRKAGSQEAQYRVDCLYPWEVGKLARQNNVRQFLLVSSVGADHESANFYLRTKGDLEEKIKSLGFPNFVSARPSFLLGERPEFRLGEKIGIVVAKLFRPIIPRHYQGIEAEQVAKCLIQFANDGRNGTRIVENEVLLEIGDATA